MTSRVIACLALLSSVLCLMPPAAGAQSGDAAASQESSPALSEPSVVATAAEPPPPAPISLSRLPSPGPDILYLEENSIKTGKSADGAVTADVWTFLALGADRSFEGANFAGAWSRDHIDCASGMVANGQVLHLLDASGKIARTVTQEVTAKPLAANSLYTFITGRICGGKNFVGVSKDSVVEAMAWAGMPSRAANAPTPPTGTVWHFAGQSADMNVAFATDTDATAGANLLYAGFSLASSRKIVGSYYESSYGYLTALEYDCTTVKARSVYATYFNILHKAADSNRTIGEWRPFEGQGLAAQVLQSVCKTGGLTTADTFTGDGKAAQTWLFDRLHKAPAKAK